MLIDAWCLGATAQTPEQLAAPVNALEAGRDPEGVWRRWINARVAGPYAAFAARCDAVLFLRAPGFEVVLNWRCEQEADLLRLPPAELPAAERSRLATFIQHYERITRHMLAGGVRADVTVALDAHRVPQAIPRI